MRVLHEYPKFVIKRYFPAASLDVLSCFIISTDSPDSQKDFTGSFK